MRYWRNQCKSEIFSKKEVVRNFAEQSFLFKMVRTRFSQREKSEIIELYFKSNESYALFVRSWRKKFGRHSKFPSLKTIRPVLKKKAVTLKND